MGKEWPGSELRYPSFCRITFRGDRIRIDGRHESFSTAGKNIVVAAGNLNAAKRILHNLNIREDDINSMLYSEYNWTDETLTQIAKALGCSVDTLKKEKAPDHMVEDLSADELEIVSILRKMSPEQLARELAYLRQIPGDAQDK